MENTLHGWCDIIQKELNEQMEQARNGIRNSSQLQDIDMLLHSLKSVKAIIAMEEASQGNYNRGGYNAYHGYNANPNSADYGRGYGGYEADGYNRRGRDSMGRYTAEGENLAQELQKLISQAPTPQIRMDMEHLAQKINNAM